MYVAKDLDDMHKVGLTICVKCNTRKVFSNEQGFLLDMFNMWLVKNGIANLLSLKCREHDGFRVTCDLYGSGF